VLEKGAVVQGDAHLSVHIGACALRVLRAAAGDAEVGGDVQHAERGADGEQNLVWGEVDAVAQSLQRPHSVVQHEAARLFLAKMKVLSSIVQQARDKFVLAACENDPHFIAFCSTVAAILLDEQE
jgi:hypothetical protein